MTRLVFGAACLRQFARADRLGVLSDLVVGLEAWVPQVVGEEIRDVGAVWLRVAPQDSVDRLRRLATWVGRAGVGDVGTAGVLAVAEELSAVAVVDEPEGARVGRAHGVDVRGTLWLLERAHRDGKLSEVGAGLAHEPGVHPRPA